jgi:hypothetical protein
MAVERLGVSQEQVLEELGYADPAQIQKEKFMEDLLTALKNAEVQRVLGSVQLEIQGKQMQMQAALQQQMQPPQGPPGQQGGSTPQQQPQPNAPQVAPEQLQGKGFNPEQGGSPSQTFAPDMTKEGQTGQPRTVAT